MRSWLLLQSSVLSISLSVICFRLSFLPSQQSNCYCYKFYFCSSLRADGGGRLGDSTEKSWMDGEIIDSRSGLFGIPKDLNLTNGALKQVFFFPLSIWVIWYSDDWLIAVWLCMTVNLWLGLLFPWFSCFWMLLYDGCNKTPQRRYIAVIAM